MTIKVRFWSQEPPEKLKSYLTILPDYQVEDFVLNWRNNVIGTNHLVAWEIHIAQNIVLDVIRVLFATYQVEYYLNDSDTPLKVEKDGKLYELWNQVEDVHCKYLIKLL